MGIIAWLAVCFLGRLSSRTRFSSGMIRHVDRRARRLEELQREGKILRWPAESVHDSVDWELLWQVLTHVDISTEIDAYTYPPVARRHARLRAHRWWWLALGMVWCYAGAATRLRAGGVAVQCVRRCWDTRCSSTLQREQIDILRPRRSTQNQRSCNCQFHKREKCFFRPGYSFLCPLFLLRIVWPRNYSVVLTWRPTTAEA